MENIYREVSGIEISKTEKMQLLIDIRVKLINLILDIGRILDYEKDEVNDYILSFVHSSLHALFLYPKASYWFNFDANRPGYVEHFLKNKCEKDFEIRKNILESHILDFIRDCRVATYDDLDICSAIKNISIKVCYDKFGIPDNE